MKLFQQNIIVIIIIFCVSEIVHLHQRNYEDVKISPNDRTISVPRYKSIKKASRNLIITFTWGNMRIADNRQLELLVQTYRRISSTTTDIVILCLDYEEDESTLTFMKTYDVSFVKVPTYICEISITCKSQNFVLFRMVAWEWFLRTHQSEYDNVVHTDADVLFQRDPFGPGCLQDISGLHVFEENQIICIGADKYHYDWIYGCPDVDNVPGPQIFNEIKNQGRICAGYVQGDAISMLLYLGIISKEVDRHSMCNDQGLLNILVWKQILIQRGVSRVVVWNNFYGPLKTLDVGYFRDSVGFAYTNYGYPYCILHQYKGDRSPEFQKMWEIIASTPQGIALPIASLPSPWDPQSRTLIRDDYSHSLGPYGDSINVSRLTVPKMIYTSMPDNRFEHGVHTSVYLMLDAGVIIPPVLDPPELKITLTEAEQWKEPQTTFLLDVWGYTSIQVKKK